MNTSKKASFPLFIGSNLADGGLSLGDIKAIDIEGFSLSDGFSSIRVDGTNGKGEVGKTNALDKYSLFGRASEIGKTFLSVNTYASVFRFELRDIKDDNKKHILYYDPRRVSPIAYVIESVDENGTTVGTFPQNTNENIFLSSPSMKESELLGAVSTVTLCLSNKTISMSEGFGDEISRLGITSFLGNDILKMSLFVSVFDKFFNPTSENIQGVKNVLPLLPDEVSPPSISDFKEGLSIKYNALSVMGAKIGGSKSFLSGEFSKNMASLGIERDILLSSSVIGDITTGVDATGAIVVIENYGVSLRGGGDIGENITKSEKLKYGIPSALATFGISISKNKSLKKPTLNALRIAEESFLFAIEHKAESLGVKSSISPLVSELKGVHIEFFNNSPLAKTMYGKIKNLERFLTRAIEREFILNGDITENGLMTENGERIKGVPNSLERGKPIMKSSSFGVPFSKLNKINFTAHLPTLTSVVGGSEAKVVNFSENMVTVFSAFVHKETGVVSGVSFANPIASWYGDGGQFRENKLQRILAEILSLNEADPKFSQKISWLINSGREVNKEEKVYTGFGFKSIENSGSEIGKIFSPLLKELRNTMYPNGKFDVSMSSTLKDKILSLSQSEEHYKKMLWLAVNSSLLHGSDNLLLHRGGYVCSNEALSSFLIAFLENEASSGFDGCSLEDIRQIKETALIIQTGVSDVYSMLNSEKNRDIIGVAKKLSDNISSVRDGILVGKTRRGEFYIPSPKWIPEIFSPSIVGGKTSFSSSVADEVFSMLDEKYNFEIDDGLNKILDEYNEVKNTEAEYNLRSVATFTQSNDQAKQESVPLFTVQEEKAKNPSQATNMPSLVGVSEHSSQKKKPNKTKPFVSPKA